MQIEEVRALIERHEKLREKIDAYNESKSDGSNPCLTYSYTYGDEEVSSVEFDDEDVAGLTAALDARLSEWQKEATDIEVRLAGVE